MKYFALLFLFILTPRGFVRAQTEASPGPLRSASIPADEVPTTFPFPPAAQPAESTESTDTAPVNAMDDRYDNIVEGRQNATDAKLRQNWPSLSACLDRNRIDIRQFYMAPLEADRSRASRLDKCVPNKKNAPQWLHTIMAQSNDYNGVSQTNCQLELGLRCQKTPSGLVYSLQVKFYDGARNYGPFVSPKVDLLKMRSFLLSDSLAKSLLIRDPTPGSVAPASAAPVASPASATSQNPPVVSSPSRSSSPNGMQDIPALFNSKAGSQ